MWIEGLTKKERELASIFHPEDWVGEYVKVIRTSKWYKDKEPEEHIMYAKLSKFIGAECHNGFPPTYRYNGFSVNMYGSACFNFTIMPHYDGPNTGSQEEIIPITRDEFIQGIKSLLTEDLQELINTDKV